MSCGCKAAGGKPKQCHCSEPVAPGPSRDPLSAASGNRTLVARRALPLPLDYASLGTSIAGTIRSEGQPLDLATRTTMESRFGRDFSQVRVHADAAAARSAAQASARAYTVGQHLVFGSGQYRPDQRAGQELIAHELVHSVQQGDGPSGNDVPRRLSQPTEASERVSGLVSNSNVVMGCFLLVGGYLVS